MSYTLHLVVMLGIYLMLAYSLNLLIGYGGLLFLCHGAFYGIGAYSYALLTTKGGLTFTTAVMVAVGVNAFLAFLFSFPALRFRGDLFVVATLGFQMIVLAVLYNWTSLTNGPYGIAGIRRPVLFGTELRTASEFAVLMIGLNLLVSACLFVLYRAPYGLCLKALRDDEAAAESIGISPFRHFSVAMTVAGGVAAISGACFAAYVTYIDPTSFSLRESILQASILLVGGSGNSKGPLAGTLLLVLLPETLRFVGLPDAVAANTREIIYGLILIILMYSRPQGLLGEFKLQ